MLRGIHRNGVVSMFQLEAHFISDFYIKHA